MFQAGCYVYNAAVTAAGLRKLQAVGAEVVCVLAVTRAIQGSLVLLHCPLLLF
jgi:hypothetical protein